MKKFLLMLAIIAGAGNLFGAASSHPTSIGEDYRNAIRLEEKESKRLAQRLQDEEKGAQIAHDEKVARKLDAQERGVPYVKPAKGFNIPSSALSTSDLANFELLK